jgi:hypothetical protein
VPTPQNEFEERIRREARRFDLKPLLDLLLARGYRWEELLFQSTTELPGSSIVLGIDFQESPRTVIITVSMGLLGDGSLLPSYFLQVVEKSDDPEKFFDFIRFFDHKLIENFVRALYPEDDTEVYSDFPEVERAFLKMLGLGSVSTLSWLGRLFFPELRTHVSRRAFTSTTASHAFKTGTSQLDGTGILGKSYDSDAAGFVLDVFADEETDSRGRGWAAIVDKRFRESLLPLLEPFHIPLIVRLKVLYHASWVKLEAPAARERGYLGYERIRGNAEGGHVLVLWRGVTGETRAA